MNKFIFFPLVLVFSACDKEPVNTASINGTVQNNGTGIGSVSVLLQSGDKKSTVNTDNQGKFEFKSLLRGDYVLSVNFDLVLRTSFDTTFKVKGNGSTNAQINQDGEKLTANIESSLDFYFTTPGGGGGGGGGSCPYIYGYNGNKYNFYGDIYAGAIYRNLERNDYTPLPGLKALDGKYRLRISNELEERHFTNLAELWFVEHPENSEAYVDKYGTLQLVQDPHTPLAALSSDGFDYTAYLSRKDHQKFSFTELISTEMTLSEKLIHPFLPQNGKTSLILDFDRPPQEKNCKLLVNVKNTDWSVYQWHHFITLFGADYAERQKSQSQKPTGELIEWQMKEAIPLMVYIETEEGWQFADYFNTVGSVCDRDLILPIDLSKITGTKLRIKLECTFMFWEIDYAAIDFSPPAEFTLTKISPEPSTSQASTEVSSALCLDDKLYLEHLHKGDESEIIYPAPTPVSDRKTSIFLHSKGYYEQIFQNKGKAQTFKLLGFIRPGSFAQYSRDRYLELRAKQPYFTYR